MPSMNDFIPKRPKAVVVGGSIAGLMSGIVLLSSDYDVTILERSSEQDFRDHGAGLGLRPEVSDFLATYCSDSSLGTVSSLTYAPSISVLDQAGEEIVSFPLPSRTKTTSWSVIVRVLRQSFLKQASLHGAESSYHHDCRVNGITPHEQGSHVEVEYNDANGASHTIIDVSLVIGADGANSTIRDMFQPVERPLAGYIHYRAMLRESQASLALRKILQEAALMQVNPGLSIISYLVPAREGNGTDITMIVYHSLGKEHLKEVMTDVDGKFHRFALPRGKLSQASDKLIRETLSSRLGPQLLEILEKSEPLIVQQTSDIKVPHRTFMDGKVLLVSDAAGLARPHTYAGTSKAAFDSMRLKDVLEGRIDIKQWEEDTAAYANACIAISIEIGDILLSDEAPLSKIGKQGALLGKLHGICSGLWQQLGK